MRKVVALLGLLVVAAGAVALKWWPGRGERAQDTLTVYGNVDFRQTEIPFNNSERIAVMLVEEGDQVIAGQVIARVETERLAAQLAEARATAAAQQAVVARLRNGTRPEEIAQARANVRAAEAERTNAQQEYDRLAAIASELGGRAVSRQDVENAQAALTIAAACR